MHFPKPSLSPSVRAMVVEHNCEEFIWGCQTSKSSSQPARGQKGPKPRFRAPESQFEAPSRPRGRLWRGCKHIRPCRRTWRRFLSSRNQKLTTRSKNNRPAEPGNEETELPSRNTKPVQTSPCAFQRLPLCQLLLR